MGASGAAIQQTLTVPGRAAAEVLQQITVAMRADGEYQVTQNGPGTVLLVRTYRPTWATVVGVMGLLLLGLGVLALLVKKTETCTVLVVDGPTGAVVTTSGRLLHGYTERLTDAAQGSAEAAVSYEAAEAIVDVQPQLSVPVLPEGVAGAVRVSEVPRLLDVSADVAEHTIVRPPRAPEPSSYLLCFDDGRKAELSDTTYVGRDPSPRSDDAAPHRLISVTDRSVSKTHLALRWSAGRVWVEDLHSTNGTMVVEPRGATVVVEPGDAVPVEAGCVVRFGDRSFEVAGV